MNNLIQEFKKTYTPPDNLSLIQEFKQKFSPQNIPKEKPISPIKQAFKEWKAPPTQEERLAPHKEYREHVRPALRETIKEATQKRLKSIKEYFTSPAELPGQPSERAKLMRDKPGLYATPPKIKAGPLPDEQYALMKLAKESGIPIASEDDLQHFKEAYNVEVSDTPLTIAGKAESLLGAGGIAKGVGLTGKALGAATWGGSKALEETSRLLVKDEELSWKQPAKIAKEATYGAALQGIHQIKSIPTRVIGGGLARSTWSTLENLINEKKITPQVITEALINFGLGAFIESAQIGLNWKEIKTAREAEKIKKEWLKTGFAKQEALMKAGKIAEIQQITQDRNLIESFWKARTANNTKAMEGIISRISNQGMKGKLTELLQIDRVTEVISKDPRIGDVSTALVVRQLPTDIHAMPPALQQEYGKQLIDAFTNTAMSLPEAGQKILDNIGLQKRNELIPLMQKHKIFWHEIEESFGRPLDEGKPLDIALALQYVKNNIKPLDSVAPIVKKELIPEPSVKPEAGQQSDLPTEPSKTITPTVPQIEKKLIPELPAKSEVFLTSRGGDKLDIAEEMPPFAKETPPEAFKLFEETENLKNKYAVRWGEKKGIPSKQFAGIYYPTSENIFIRSANNLSTAAHEIAHHIDTRIKFLQKITQTIGADIKGRPKYNPATQKIRNEFTEAYVTLYAGGKKDHPLSKRMQEGFATVIEHYITHPNEILKNYPEIIKQLITPGGQYYDPLITEFIKDAQGIVRRYQKLDPLYKVMTRMSDNEATVGEKKFLTRLQRLDDELFDDLAFLETKLEKGSGIEWTERSPSLRARAYRTVDSMITRNIMDNKGYWTLNDKLEPVKKYDFSINTLKKIMKKNKSLDTFPAYLITRRAHFDYLELDKLKNEFYTLKKIVKDWIEEGTNPNDYPDFVKKFNVAKKQYFELKKNLSQDRFDRKTIKEAYNLYKNDFKEEEKMFDAFTKTDRELLANPLIQKISPKILDKWNKKDWYAPYMREWHNEIIGKPEFTNVQIKGAGKGKISPLMKRKGSDLRIINPVVSMIKNHMEIVKKSMRQSVYNAMLNIVDANPDMFQVLPYRRGIEKDPNVIIAMRDYKRVPILVNRNIKQLLDEILTFKDMHKIEKLTTAFSRMFVKGTTGIYFPFAIANFPMDQFVMGAQTFNRTKPFIDPINTAIKLLIKHDSPEAKYWQEYLTMGGERQTLQRMFNTPSLLQNELKGISNLVYYLDKGLDLAAIPTEYSELITRGTEYIRARKAGKHPFVALEEAGRVTAPFHHRPRAGGGSAGISLMSSKPYLRSTLQAFREHLRTATDPKRQKQLAFTMAVVTTAMVGSLAYLLQKGSEEQKMAFKGLYPQELSRGIYYPCPWDKKKLCRIPIREQLGVLGTVINMAIADIQLDANYSINDYIDGITSFIPEHLNITNPERLILSWIPQIIGPTLESIYGKKTWPKIKDIEAGLKNLPPELRYYESTSHFAKWIGKTFKLSPVKVDHLIEGYLGRATRVFTRKRISNPYVREMYFTAARPLQNFYKLHTEYTQKYKAGLLTSQKELITYKQLQTINHLLKKYKKMDINSERADIYRKEIITRIDTL